VYLSFSGYTASDCQFRYWNQYINKTKILKESDDRINSLFGSSIGLLFERFYREALWRSNDVRQILSDLVPSIVDGVIWSETEDRSKPWRTPGVIRWRTPDNPNAVYLNKEDIYAEVRSCIPKGLQTIKQYRLLGKVEPELKIDVTIQGHTLAGRLDFLLESAVDHQLYILDGKGTKSPKYLTEDQLLWYGVGYREKFKRTPDKLAYVLWREEPPSSMIFYDVNDEILDRFKSVVLLRLRTLEALSLNAPKGCGVNRALAVFQPDASKSNCRFCDYGVEGICTKGFEIKQSLEQSRKKYNNE
jgi:hypothetical protein